MGDVTQAFVEYNKAMDDLEKAEQGVQAALANIKNSANSSTIEMDGQYFQVRERREKLYLCELSGKPRGRPKGSKNSKPRKGSAAAAAADADAVLSEVDVESAEASADANTEVSDEIIEVAPVAVASAETSTEETSDTVPYEDDEYDAPSTTHPRINGHDPDAEDLVDTATAQ